LTPSGGETYRDSEPLQANFNPDYNSQKTYWYKWYKGADLNATTLIDRNLIGYWPLNKDTNDYWGTNNGTSVGATQAAGKVGGAYGFNGSSYISIPQFTIGTASVSGWFKSSALTMSENIIFGATKSNNDLYWKCMVNQNSAILGYMPTVTDYRYWVTTPSLNLNNNAWHHVVCTLDISTLTPHVYVDGTDMALTLQQQGTPSGSISQPISIGRAGAYNNYYLNGSIDEVMVFNRVLSASEAQQLYYGGLYDGNKMDSSRTTVGEQWKAGYQYNSLGGQSNWSADANSQTVTIAS
jgi:hypothetical protein